MYDAMTRALASRLGQSQTLVMEHGCLVELVRNGSIDPIAILTQREPIANAIDACKAFDKRQLGWMRVKLEP